MCLAARGCLDGQMAQMAALSLACFIASREGRQLGLRVKWADPAETGNNRSTTASKQPRRSMRFNMDIPPAKSGNQLPSAAPKNPKSDRFCRHNPRMPSKGTTADARIRVMAPPPSRLWRLSPEVLQCSLLPTRSCPTTPRNDRPCLKPTMVQKRARASHSSAL